MFMTLVVCIALISRFKFFVKLMCHEISCNKVYHCPSEQPSGCNMFLMLSARKLKLTFQQKIVVLTEDKYFQEVRERDL